MGKSIIPFTNIFSSGRNMRNLKFKYAAAYNFLPFGPEGIEIHFDKFKNIILVRGVNLDAKAIDPALPSDEMKISSNGTGKSSIQEIVTYGLYGKTVKRPEKLGANDVVHNKIGKDAKIELIFDDIRIIRVRKENGKDTKNSLRVWESKEGIWDKSTEITQGTMVTTQKKIEDTIGLSYEAFVNICIFTDDQRACFLECDNKQKKEIVENMLSLGAYREWFENAKNLRKEIKTKIETKTKEYELLQNTMGDAERRLELAKQKEKKWIEDKKQEIENIVAKVKIIAAMLGKTDNGIALLAYEEAQEKIKEINEKMPVVEKDKKDIQDKLDLAREKESALKTEAQEIVSQYNDMAKTTKDYLAQRKTKEQDLEHLKNHEVGSKCDKCHGDVLEENLTTYAESVKSDITALNKKIQVCVEETKTIGVKVDAVKEKQEKLKAFISQFAKKIEGCDAELKKLRDELVNASKVREPKTDNAEIELQEKIKSFKDQIQEKSNELAGKSPFKDIVENDEAELKKAKQDVAQKEAEVKECEAETPYYDYWIKGFGDQGIRKWIVDGIVPELNNRVNYWLQFLIDNRITLKFDNELNEIIERNPPDGDPYIYHAMSTGQRRRLNLAVSQSFAHIMMMSTGSVPSLVFLDEVTTNVDPLGVQGIYNMVSELAEDKQVFVTTHDSDLTKMLEGVDTLKLVHQNGFTTMIE
jgi:DNA repair exonuclease SbcCD ATPase subunit